MTKTNSAHSVSLLTQLSEAFGVSGFEDDIRGVIAQFVKSLVDEMHVDPLGNLIVTRKGKSDFTLMLDAHMDEVGLIISYIEEKGFLRFAPLGGWDIRILPAQIVKIRTRQKKLITGVIGSVPPHVLKPEDREKPLKIEDLFIDIGAFSAEEVQKMGIRVGDPAVPYYPAERLSENVIGGKAFDDRAGCAVIIQTLQALQKENLNLTLVCNFAIGEETGLRGARAAAYSINPNTALALEGTIGADVPGVVPARQPTALGQGPAITIADNTLVVSRRVVEALEKLSEKLKIPYQYKLPVYGGTDAGAIHTTRGGILAGVLAVPCRYIHSQFSLLRLDDLENTVKLTVGFVRECRELLS